MGAIKDKQLNNVKKFYYRDKLSMKEVADRMDTTIEAVIYFMRRNNLKRRTFQETNKIRFEKTPLSFEKADISTEYLKELEIIGMMLYWGEGFKSEKCKVVDLANSDPKMILIFLNFLRKIFQVDETRLRVYLYCHSNQQSSDLINFWSNLTRIPSKQFCKPYIRQDYDINKREMKYGLVHIRYSDKRLIQEIKKSIEAYKIKYAN